jgi:hypothetical protein
MSVIAYHALPSVVGDGFIGVRWLNTIHRCGCAREMDSRKRDEVFPHSGHDCAEWP